MARYHKPVAGEWVKPVRRGYKLMCCDCGLVHEMDFKALKDSIGRARIFFRVTARNERATALARRQNDFKCKPSGRK